MAAYSPISSRNHRINTAPPYQISAAYATTAAGSASTHTPTAGHTTTNNRRRESVNSSIGATSIRRLLTVNRGCRHKIPVHIRAKVAKNFTFLILAHGLSAAVLIPLFGLQASNSVWFHQEAWLLRIIGPNVGPLLLSLCCIITSSMCLVTTKLVKKVGYLTLIIAHYVTLCLFVLSHLYPSIWLLLPVYILLALTLGPAWICKWNLVVFFANRLSCGQHECANTTMINETTEEHKTYCNRNERVRRLARWFHAVQDIGIFFGALSASLIISCASTDTGCFYLNTFLRGGISPFAGGSSSSSISTTELGINNNNNSNINISSNNNKSNTLNMLNKGIDTSLSGTNLLAFNNNNNNIFNKNNNNNNNNDRNDKNTSAKVNLTENVAPTVGVATNEINLLKFYQESILFQWHNELLDSLYNTNEQGERICGAGSCPTWDYIAFEANSTEQFNWFTYSGTIPTTIFYLLLALIALTLSCLSQQVDNTFKCESVKGIKDTLLFASPMAYFIGTEQGYVLGDFTRAFVSCSLGAQMVAGALVGMGLMQLIVSCTLSMLLRHTKRVAVLAAAFFFHACLLLVLSSWKPSKDDSALFYVIAAAWGACNGIWETLLFAFITLTHPNHMIDTASPLQACRFLGLGITFAAHGYLCENVKIIILFILLLVSVIPYAMLEIRMETQRKSHSASI